ncbi:MAG: sarcosine oxidase subunit gamma [Hyphomicrobiales bacterium]
MSDAMQITALYDRGTPENLLIGVEEVRDYGMIDVRGLATDRKFMAAAKKALGFDFPKKPRTSKVEKGITCLWLSVDQWLVLCPLKSKDALLKKLLSATADTNALIVDVSDARAVIRLTGAEVRHVLMKGASVDFTQKEFGEGTVRRVSFAEIAAMVHVVPGAADTFDLLMFRSQAHHAWNWLAATAKSGSNKGLPGKLEAPATV